jgi:hypothetical protein
MPGNSLLYQNISETMESIHSWRSLMMQALQTPKRFRGFRLTATGWQKLEARIHWLEGQTQIRQNARTIAEQVQLSTPEGIHPMTVRKILQCQQGVDKRSIEQVFEALNLALVEGDYAHASLSQTQPVSDYLTVQALPQRSEPKDEKFQKTVMFNHESQMLAILEIEGGYCIIVSK